jgi:hypothetical protein
MNPRNHPRGSPPDFALPKPNPNRSRMTDALWWLVCMRELLEPKLSANGGTFADKPGFHNAGERLTDHGPGDSRTDHSIRHAVNRTGPWWRTRTAAHDWTFRDAQAGDYATIRKYTNRLIGSMRSLTDLRPDDVYWYTLGQGDNDAVVEGWHERDDEILSSSDLTHLWHRHDSFRRNIVGSFPHMWQALTIDMGWTYAEWQRSVAPQEDDMPTPEEYAAAVWAHRLVDPRSTTEPRGTKPAGDFQRYSDVVNQKTTDDVLRAVGPVLRSIASADHVDEQALAATLAPAVAALVVASLPPDSAEISQAEVNAVVERALRNALGTR